MQNNILSIHFGHHGAFSYIRNNEVVFHSQFDRFSKLKNFGIFSKSVLDIFSNLDFDTLLLTDINNSMLPKEFNQIKLINPFFYKKICNSKIITCSDQHHLFHAYAIDLWSKEKNKKIFVMDGDGVKLKNSNATEQESFYTLNENNIYHHFTTSKNIGSLYERRASQLFISPVSEGKLMALSSYGLFNKKYYNNDIIDVSTKEEKEDYAKTTQRYCEDKVISILKENIDNKDETIFFTGGVAQNVLLNTKIKKIYKNFQPDPICNDAGISLGSANFYLKGKIKKLNSVYLGVQQKLDLSLYNLTVKNCTEEEVAKILQEEPVAIFQSRSEQGQRGLGNRSLLMSPLNKKCFVKLNEIKKREWFRPFALSILDEEGQNWFEDYFTSKYMKFVFKLKTNKRSIIYSGYGRDFSSRIQSVTKSSNPHYYSLLKAFHNITNCPCIINTSLNLPGSVLVETIEDLMNLLKTSKLKYVYLPETKKLIYDNKQ